MTTQGAALGGGIVELRKNRYLQIRFAEPPPANRVFRALFIAGGVVVLLPRLSGRRLSREGFRGASWSFVGAKKRPAIAIAR